jgi:hypothetical protein
MTDTGTSTKSQSQARIRARSGRPDKGLWSAKIEIGFLNAFSSRYDSLSRDAGHRGWMSLQLCSPSECDAVGFEALPSVNSDLAFRVHDWNADGPDYNGPPNI